MNRTFAILLTAAAILWVGCGKSGSRTVTAPDGSQATVTSEGDRTSVTIKGAKGEMIHVAQGGSDVPLPEGFPADVPIYAGAKVTVSSTVGEAMIVSFETGDPLKKVMGFYEDKLKAGGWKIQQTTSTADGGMLSGTKNNRTCLVLVGTSGQKTTVNLNITAKGG